MGKAKKDAVEAVRDVHSRVRFPKQNLAITAEVTERQNGKGGYFGAVKLHHDSEATADGWTRSMLLFVSKDDVRAFDEAWNGKLRDKLLKSSELPKHTPKRKTAKAKAETDVEDL